MFEGFGEVQFVLMLVLAIAPIILAIWIVVQIVAIRRALERIARTLEAGASREHL
jgi:uncharacterized protein YoxC